MPCAASPPSTFCQEKVATSIFAPVDGLRAQRRRRIDEGETAAVGGDPIAVRHAHARCRAVPGEDHVAIEVDAGEIGQMPVVGRRARACRPASARRRCRPPSAGRNPPRPARRRRARRASTTAPSRKRRCRTRERWRGGSRREARAAHASCRWRAAAARCRPASGASARAAPTTAPAASSRGAWRMARSRSSGSPGAALAYRDGS